MFSPCKTVLFTVGLVSSSPAFSITVAINCDSLNQSLQQLIDSVPEDSIINLSGTCREPIQIAKDRIELSGGGKAGASFTFPEGTFNGLSITGRQIVIKKLNVSGAQKSIVVFRSGSVRIADTHVSRSGSIGLEVTESSYARILDSTISDSERNGIVVRLSSSADIHDDVIANHQSYGIVLDNSAADIDGNTISDNKNYGLFVHSNSRARLGGDNTSGKPNHFSNNTEGAIRCDLNSTLQLRIEQQFDNPNKAYKLAESCALSSDTSD